jgi:hypothetical protein
MGLQIDSDLCSAEALLTYRRLVRHYLHHRPLRDAAGKGTFLFASQPVDAHLVRTRCRLLAILEE